MVKMNVLNDCLRSIVNAERKDKEENKSQLDQHPNYSVYIEHFPKKLKQYIKLQILFINRLSFSIIFIKMMIKSQSLANNKLHSQIFDLQIHILSNTILCALGIVVKFLQVMQRHGYIGEFEIVDDHRSGKIVVELLGRINKCGVISPRYDVTLGEFEKWANNILPARQFGCVVLTTNVGILTHEEARQRHIGGKILGFFY